MFGWLTSKKSLLKSGLLVGMTDVHSHLLPGVDDGIQTWSEALVALSYLEKEIGVERIFLTPHIMGDLIDNNRAKLIERFVSLESVYRGHISIRLSGEYMLDAGFCRHLADGLLAMNDNHVLVETSYLSAPPEMENLLYELSISGYTPVIAHPERYVYMSDNDRYLLKDRGCKFQLNLMSLAGTYGKGTSRCALELLKGGFYDFVGSDFHNTTIYEHSLRHLSIGKSEEKQIKQLLENNRMLWK